MQFQILSQLKFESFIRNLKVEVQKLQTNKIIK